jgi:hypothetical protein
VLMPRSTRKNEDVRVARRRANTSLPITAIQPVYVSSTVVALTRYEWQLLHLPAN